MFYLMNRAQHVMNGEDGASNMEIIVWMAVVLAIAVFLFTFKDAITRFISKATNTVDSMTNTTTSSLNAGSS